MTVLTPAISFGRLELPHLGDEAIPTFRYSFNVASPIFPIAQCLAQQVNDLAQIVLFDHRIPPHRLHQGVFFQQAAAVLHQHQQSVKGPGREIHAHPTVSDQTLARI